MEPYIGQIMVVGFTFAPKGWMSCQGQILSIAQNTALFSLLGTTYGGDGQTTFRLPDLQGRMLVGQGNGPGLPPISIGEIAGTPTVTLTSAQMPMHIHTATFTPTGGGAVSGTLEAMTGAAASETSGPTAGAFLGVATDPSEASSPALYVPAGTAGTTPVNLGGLNITGGTGGGSVTVAPNGGSQPFSIMPPFLGMQINIALQGIFPSRN